MMKTILSMTLPAVMLGGVALSSAPAQAQVGLEFGPRGARVYTDDGYRPAGERRIYRERRTVVEDDAEECRTVVRRRVNRFGDEVVRRERICE